MGIRGMMAKSNVEKNEDYILLLERVLDVCCELAKENEQVEFSTDYVEEFYKVGDKGWGNRLVFCVHNAIENATDKLKIRDVSQKQIRYIKIAEDISCIVPGDKDNKKEILREQVKRLSNNFVSDNLVKELEKLTDIFLEKNSKVVTEKNIFCMKEEEMEEYLTSYYNLLNSFVLDDDIYTNSVEKKGFIRELLLLDSKYNEIDDTYIFNFSSPIIMNRIEKVNKGVEEFYNNIIKQEEVSREPLQLLYKRILLTKAKHMFRWYVTGREKELYHAAIANYVQKKNQCWQFNIVAKNINDYNSFEGIGELRLAEKIIYEFNLSKKKKFRVAIAGDIWGKPLCELYKYVYQKICHQNEKVQLIFNIYTKNELEFSNEYLIEHRGDAKKILQNKEELREVIDENDILFLLDCIELYQIADCTERNKIDYYRQRFSFNKYKDMSLGFAKYMDISNSNMLDELYENMTMFCQNNYMGKLQKKANEALLSFCEKECEANKTVAYIYVSDLAAFEKIYNDYRYYIRTEKYNEKEVGIIRYSNEKTVFLENGNSCMLVFNMWQFLKHIAIEERQLWLRTLSDELGDIGYEELTEMLIGVDYSDWKNSLKLHYCVTEKKGEGERLNKSRKQVTENFINKVLLPILNCDEKNMFNAYIEKAICSFFYSVAKSVEDMIFLHLFEREREKIGKARIAQMNEPKKVKDNKDDTFRYSLKRFYNLITSNYDISATDSIGQFRTTQIIEKNAVTNPLINKKEIFEKVIKACKSIGYQDSYLEQNCMKEIYD